MNERSVSKKTKLEQLSTQKRDLIRLLREDRSRQARRIRAYPRHSGELIPASWAQQRLWLIDQLERGSAGYKIPVAVRLRGSLNQEALRSALDAIVLRHESLRTVFVEKEGVPYQRVQPAAGFPIKVFDLSDSDDATLEVQIRAHRAEEVNDSFDLQRGPLLRGRLLKLGVDHHILLVTTHHIISDGWSTGVFLRELTALYTARLDTREGSLDTLPVQYSDYAQWQREPFHAEELQRQLTYWRKNLAGVPPQLDLPTDRPRPAAQTYRGGNVAVELDEELTSRLRSFSQRHGLTMFMLLCGAWAVFLKRISGQGDIAIGTPVAGRELPEFEDLIGFFANTMVLRFDVGSDISLDRFLDQVKATTLAAYDNQNAPFERVVEALQPDRSLSRNPIFQVMFALQSKSTGELHMPDLLGTLEEGVDEPAIFDVLMALVDTGDRVSGSINYAMDLFDRGTIERWVESFKVLLRAIPLSLEGLLDDLPILSDRDRQQILNEFNSPTASPTGRRVHELCEEQVVKTPDRIAVQFAEKFISYSELHARSNTVAAYLRSQNVLPGDLVGICLERGPELPIGVLGVLKAGAAYLPVDPAYPLERIRFMLEDARPRAIVTQESLRSIVLPVAEQIVVMVDGSLRGTTRVMNENSDAERSRAGDLVYVIYTSGTTGKPKGTAMAHDAMANLIEWHTNSPHLSQGQRVLQFAPLSFDVAFQEIFSALCTGSTLVLVSENTRRDPGALLDLLRQESIQRIFIPPVMLQSLSETSLSESADAVESLGDVVVAGEQLRVSDEVRSFFRQRCAGRLHNHYGPTESHVVTALTLDGNANEWPTFPSIGRPIENSRVYVLDERTGLLPIGVWGEIYIGGPVLARGYLGQPALTATRFLADPFLENSGRRLYRTGDIGRWRPDGTLEYFGRNDTQVKIRGYRVELGEIESQLARLSSIREAVVIVLGAAEKTRTLVAYITRRGDSLVDPQVIRSHLKESLPEYMIPSAFVILDTLPLTPSGKLDRRALPVPGLEAYTSREYEPPEGEVETLLADHWMELLKLERIGRKDNFFEIGGHSLLAARVVAHIGKTLELEISLRALFECPTIESLGRRIIDHIAAEIDTEE